MSRPGINDEDARTVLAMRAAGHSYRVIGEAIGKSKAAVIGFLHRSLADADAIPCECEKLENKDGAGWTWNA